jgi:hypothetical protein
VVRPTAQHPDDPRCRRRLLSQVHCSPKTTRLCNSFPYHGHCISDSRHCRHHYSVVVVPKRDRSRRQSPRIVLFKSWKGYAGDTYSRCRCQNEADCTRPTGRSSLKDRNYLEEACINTSLFTAATRDYQARPGMYYRNISISTLVCYRIHCNCDFSAALSILH